MRSPPPVAGGGGDTSPARLGVPFECMSAISRRLTRLQDGLKPLLQFLNESEHARRAGDPSICDFVFGNPQEMPLAGLVEAIRHHAIPADKDWFAYTLH